LIRALEGQRTIDVLTKVQLSIGKILANLPLSLYDTAHAKQVRNYMEFMSSAAYSISYDDILSDFAACGQEFISKVAVNSFGLAEAACLNICQLLDGRWPIWIEGDELIPAFQDEKEAYRFMKGRLSLYEGFSCDAYDDYFLWQGRQ
jgi:hypothetical protein